MLTPAQQAAISSTHHTAVIANAGSGKTRVLVEKFINILLNEPELHPRDVVAITFSDPSARDLREKIKLRIDELLHAEITPESQLSRLRTLRDEVQIASISTIHSFCSKLLRLYPLEAKIDATFGILRSPEDAILRDECINDTLYEALSLGYEGKAPYATVVLPLIQTIGRTATTRVLNTLLQSRYRADILTSHIESTSDEELALAWKKMVEDTLQEKVINGFDAALYSRLLGSLSKIDKKSQEAIDALATFQESDGLSRKLTALTALLAAVHNTKWEEISSNIKKNGDSSLFESVLLNAASVLPFRDLIESYFHASIDDPTPRYSSILRSILFLYKEVKGLYDERKTSFSLLDFDDLLLKALHLLSNEDVARELVASYRYILVDEYQDTDDIQFEIIRALTKDFSSGQLMVVGDPKQSIYRFRNANIELFNKTVSRIAHTTDGTQSILQESFRMLAAPLAVINNVFKPLFATSSDVRTMIEYSPLILGRKDVSEGSVTIIRATGKDDEDAPEESELIARKIAELVRGEQSSVSVIDKNGVSQKPTYKDIALLLRTRTSQSRLEEALRKYNIPFIVHRGSGFYSQQEIIDIVSYLRFLLSPADDIALVGVLRSPFFAVTDDELVKIALHSQASKLWEKLTSFIATNDGSDALKRAYKELTENLSIAGRTTPTKIIRKIFDETGIYAIYKALPNGDQVLGNIEKFASIISASESSTFSSLFDLVERLNMYMERSDEEALAEISNDNDAVHILTIHGSKGLEFPIVFAPFLHRDLGKSDSRRGKTAVFSDIGLPLKVPNLSQQPPIVELMKLRDKLEQSEEEKRIFYVALTRAREHLFLSLTLDEEKHPPLRSFASWIAMTSDSDFSNDIHLSSEIIRYDDATGKHHPKTVDVVIPVLHDVPLTKYKKETTTSSNREKVTTHLEAIPPSNAHVRYSPSQLLTYLECPTKYYLRYDLGIPEDPRISFSFEPADQAEFIKGTIIGQLVHSIFEKIDDIVTDGILNEEKYAQSLGVALERLAIDPKEYLQRYSMRVLQHIRAFLANKEAKAILASTPHFTELPLRAMLSEGKMLSGIIDRVYQTDDGTWTILDYKTDRRLDAPNKNERYEFQLKFYAYLIHALHPEQREIKARLFFSNYSIFKNYIFTERELSTVGKELDLLVAKIRLDKTAISLSMIERNRTHCPECAYYDVQRDSCLADKKKSQKPTETPIL